MEAQTVQVQKIDCSNAYQGKDDFDRVFCSRANDWISIKNCGKCGSERKERMSMEW